jgi:Ca2+-transporting ATPase
MVEAVKLGRRIFDNIQKAMCYIIAVHIPTAGMALLPLLFGWPLVFYPVHIVFLEFVIDPACSIAFEAESADPDAMHRPPRPATSHLFNRWMVATSVLQGFGVLVAVAVLYGLVLAMRMPEPQARAMAFVAIVLGNVGLILCNRSPRAPLIETLRRPNSALWWIVGGALLGLALALLVEPLREIFRFGVLGWTQLLMSIAAAVVGLTWLELYKSLRRRRVRVGGDSMRGSSSGPSLNRLDPPS